MYGLCRRTPSSFDVRGLLQCDCGITDFGIACGVIPVGIAPELIVEGELGLLPDISDASQWESAMDFVAQNHET